MAGGGADYLDNLRYTGKIPFSNFDKKIYARIVIMNYLKRKRIKFRRP